jgi:hypothetical protein
MSTTNSRVEALLERWLASVDLHARYLQLDDSAYARVESWPKHQRPNAFVVQLARTRLLELKAHLAERRDAGDQKFAEALELMSFLTTLLGSEHIERFIPLATGTPPSAATSATVEPPRPRPAAKPIARKSATAESSMDRVAPAPKHAATRVTAAPYVPRDTATRQSAAGRPKPSPATTGVTRASSSAGPARSTSAQSRTRPEPAPQSATPASPPVESQVSAPMTQQVIADAIRMLEWGREWPAVAGLIARMADRPSEADIWKILRAHRADIMSKARRSTG